VDDDLQMDGKTSPTAQHVLHPSRFRQGSSLQSAASLTAAPAQDGASLRNPFGADGPAGPRQASRSAVSGIGRSTRSTPPEEAHDDPQHAGRYADERDGLAPDSREPHYERGDQEHANEGNEQCRDEPRMHERNCHARQKPRHTAQRRLPIEPSARRPAHSLCNPIVGDCHGRGRGEDEEGQVLQTILLMANSLRSDLFSPSQ